MLEIPLHDLVVSRRRVEALSPAGNCRNADKLSVLVERSGLLAKIDDDGRGAANAVVIPVGLLEGQTFLRGGIDNWAAGPQIFECRGY